MKTQVAAIFAISENKVIGKDQNIPWRLSEDLKRFKRLTLDKPIIMGRKTWESLGRPLPRRRHIIITRNRDYKVEGCEVVHSLEAALDLCKGEPLAFVIGGSSIYAEAFEKGLVDLLYKTLVHAEIEGDTLLEINEAGFEISHVDSRQADEKNEFAYTFVDLKKRFKDNKI